MGKALTKPMYAVESYKILFLSFSEICINDNTVDNSYNF